MPMVKARKQTSIPSVWTKEELTKVIGAIDRASPKGKRDYAIILIACRLGLRCRDIKNLRLAACRRERMGSDASCSASACGVHGTSTSARTACGHRQNRVSNGDRTTWKDAPSPR